MNTVALASVAVVAIVACFHTRSDKALGFYLLALLALIAAGGAA